MPTKLNRLPVRTSAALRSVIDQAGPVNAATRALLWLGADAVGQAISTAGQREIAGLLAEETLAPGVLMALQRLYHRLTNAGEGGTTREALPGTISDTFSAVTHGTARAPTTPAPAALTLWRDSETDTDDPFADVGREFEG